MAHITALMPTLRDPTRITIHVADKSVGTISSAQVQELGLTLDMPFDQLLADKVAQAVAIDKAMRDALKRLNRRALSSGDLKRKLRQRDHDPDAIDAAINLLIDRQLLDDEAYGRALIHQTLNRKPAGPMLLRSKLMQKGLARDLIDRLLKELTSTGDEAVAGAVQLIEKKLPSMRNLDTQTKNRRLWGMLGRRGFSSDVVKQAMKQSSDEDSS
jgi:SOS response regulatory protein OraA/RecX